MVSSILQGLRATLCGLVLVAASSTASSTSRVTIFDEDVRVGRLRSRAVPISLHQRPAMVECRFEITNGQKEGVRAVLMTMDDVDRFREDRSHRTLASSAYDTRGELRYRISRPGDYMLLVDNREGVRGAAMVRLKIDLTFDNEVSFAPKTLPPARRQQIVAVSLGLFALVAAWSGWRIWGALRRRV